MTSVLRDVDTKDYSEYQNYATFYQLELADQNGQRATAAVFERAITAIIVSFDLPSLILFNNR